MFEKILIIGFKNSFKLKQMELIYGHFNYTIVEACHVKNLTPNGLKQKRRSEHCRLNTDEFYLEYFYFNKKIKCIFPMTPMEVACCLSHLKANQYIVDNKCNNVLIIEDDAYPSPLITENITLPHDYDYLLLHNSDEPGPLKFIKGVGDSAVAYMVKNKNSALRYLNFFQAGLMCSDSPFSFPDLPFNIYKSTKNIFYHDITYSYLSNYSEVAIQ